MPMFSELKQAAEKSREKKAAIGQDLDLKQFQRQAEDWSYDENYQNFDAQEKEHLLLASIKLTDEDHAGTFLQADRSIMHCKTSQPGLEILPIKDALQKYDGLKEYYWQLVSVETDKYTAATET